MKHLLPKWRAKNLQFADVQGKGSGALKSHPVVFLPNCLSNSAWFWKSVQTLWNFLFHFPSPPYPAPHFSHPFLLLFRPAALRGCDLQSPGVPQQVGPNLRGICRCSLVQTLSNNTNTRTIILQGAAGHRSWLQLLTVPFKISSPMTLNPHSKSWGGYVLLCVLPRQRFSPTEWMCKAPVMGWSNWHSFEEIQESWIWSIKAANKTPTHCISGKTPVSMFLPQALPGIMGIKLALKTRGQKMT